jgi:DNA polymerase III alpha subunit (gram-positive type)
MIHTNTCVFDFETTGLRPSDGASVLEVAALRIRSGKAVGSYSELFHPGCQIPARITEITGITDGDVAGCRTWQQAIQGLMGFMGDALLVGHNVAFDLGFLNHYSELYLNAPITNSFVDTRGMAIHAWPYKPHRLTDCCRYAGIELRDAHRALADVEMTWDLAEHLWDRWGDYCANGEAQNRDWYVDRVLHYRKYRHDPPFVPQHGALELVG